MTDKTMDVPVVQITTVGTGDGGLQKSTSAQTPSGMPNVYVTVVSRAKAIAIRFGHRFLDAFVGAEGLQTVDSMAGWELIPGSAYKIALLFALTTAGWGALRDMGTIFTKLEETHPLSSGNI